MANIIDDRLWNASRRILVFILVFGGYGGLQKRELTRRSKLFGPGEFVEPTADPRDELSPMFLGNRQCLFDGLKCLGCLTRFCVALRKIEEQFRVLMLRDCHRSLGE